MSRIGRMPVVIPAGTEVTVADGNVCYRKGKARNSHTDL